MNSIARDIDFLGQFWAAARLSHRVARRLANRQSDLFSIHARHGRGQLNTNQADLAMIGSRGLIFLLRYSLDGLALLYQYPATQDRGMAEMQDTTETPAAKTVTVEIVSRWDAAKILFSTQVDVSVPLVGRVRAAVAAAWKAKADMSGANLSRADMSGANLSRADMSGADLSGANLSGANLSGANLSGATYRDVKLGRRGEVKNASRSDGYVFRLLDCDDGNWRVMAGCRWFTLAEAWAHWTATRDATPIGEETFDILVMFEHHAARLDGREFGA